MTWMKMTALAGLGAAAFASAAHAQAIEGVDVSAGYSRLSSDDLDLDAVVLRGTLHVTRNFGGELEGQFGLGDDSVGGASVELDTGWGIFARGDVPIGDTGAVFGRVGYVDYSASASTPLLSVGLDDNGWAAGVGGEFFFLGPNGVRVDYTRFEFDDDDADGFSVAYVRRLGR